MSNSRRFLLIAASTAMLALLLLVVTTVLTDSRGLIAATFPGSPRLCAPGADHSPRELKPYLPLPLQPREILIGNSRVDAGFAESDAVALLRGPVLNLGVEGATMYEAARLTRHAWSVAPVKRVWLLLDFTMFEDDNRSLAIPRPRDPRLFAIRYGLLNSASLRRSLEYLVDPSRCAEPLYTFTGFQNPLTGAERRSGNAATFRHNGEVYAATYRQWFARDAGQRRSHAGKQRALLRALIREARARGVQLVLFTAPVHPRYTQILEESGFGPDYRAWQRDVAALAAREGGGGVAFFDLSRHPALLIGTTEPQCAEAGPPECAFYDPVHYRPALGRQILELILPQLTPGTERPT